MDRLNMSLDQLIESSQKSKQSNNKRDNGNKQGGKNFGAAKKPRANPNADDRNVQPYSQKVFHDKQPLTYRPIKVGGEQKTTFTVSVGNNASSGSVFDRVGRPQSGTYVVFTNLNRSVATSDLQELCGSIGELKDVQKPVNGTAKVLFARRSDANACVAKYNGLTLDNSVMNVALAEDAAKPLSVFDRVGSAPAASNNVRGGLFGSALADDDEEGEESDGDNAGPTFRVTLKGAPPTGGERRNNNNNNNNRNNNGNKGGKKNGGRRNGGGGGNREPKEPKKEINLDDDLDEYMKAR